MSCEFQFGACETSMQTAPKEQGTIFARPMVMASAMYDTLSEHLRGVPSHCKMVTLAMVFAVFVASYFAPLWTLVVTALATSAICHGLEKIRHKRVLPKMATAPIVERFYNHAPHKMVVRENPVFANDEDRVNGRAKDTPWRADETEVAIGIQEMQQLTPPDLLAAAQSNAVPLTPVCTVQKTCPFPSAFSDLGERLA